MYKRVNFTDDDKGVHSITLTEPLIQIKNATDYFAEAIAHTLIEERAIKIHKNLLKKAEKWKNLDEISRRE